MAHRKLHTLHRPAKKHNGHPPLVFVHGGYVHGGCWDVNFMPHFNTLGYHCHAIDLSGHGQSEGRERLNSYDLNHYAADVAQVVAGLAVPPVLIGHSMGALVVQRYLEKGKAAAVIMMAPVPTTGLAGCSAQMAHKQPDFLVEAARAVRGKYTEKTIRVMRPAENPGTGDGRRTRCAVPLQPALFHGLRLERRNLRDPARRPHDDDGAALGRGRRQDSQLPRPPPGAESAGRRLS